MCDFLNELAVNKSEELTKICRVCGSIKPLSMFSKHKLGRHGVDRLCLVCKGKRAKKRRQRLAETVVEPKGVCRVCVKCQILKDLSEFTTDADGKFGKRSVCNSCNRIRNRSRNLKNKTEFNLIYWNRRANHFSETVTGFKLRAMYYEQKEKCAYCGVFLNRIFHVDHKLPKSKGGLGSLENLHIICIDCNRLKYTKTHEEFLIFLKEYASRIENMKTKIS